MGPLEVAVPMSYGARALRCYGATVLRCYDAASAKSQMDRCRFGPKLRRLWLMAGSDLSALWQWRSRSAFVRSICHKRAKTSA